VMVVKRMYGDEELRGKLLTEVNVKGWPMNRACVCEFHVK